MSNERLEQLAPGTLGVTGFVFSASGLYYGIRGAIFLLNGRWVAGAVYLLAGVAVGWVSLVFWRALWSVRKKRKGKTKGA